LGRTPLGHLTIEPGSYLLVFEAPRRAPVRLPVLVARGEKLDLRVPLPGEHDVPPGFVYVPAGRFLYGSDNGDMRKFFFYAPPLHEVTTHPYLIQRNEVTFADWILYLRSLPATERARRAPATQAEGGETARVVLRELDDGTWQLTLQPTNRAFVL